MKVVDYIAKYIQNLGINHVFGYQGAAINPLIDAFVKTGTIEYVQSYHEQASGFGADAYSRITGKIGIAVATNGPGVTNLISGIANAHLDSVPCLFITGQVNTFDMNPSFLNIRQHSFQEVDTISMVKPITKYAKTIKDATKIKYELDKAIHIALSGRKGAVLIDLPFDIQNEEIEERFLESYNKQEKVLDEKKVSKNISKTIEMLTASKRPVIVIGGGVRTSNAIDELEELIEKTSIPTVSTLMGLDVFSTTNVGFAGLYGTTTANLAVYNSDLVIVLGSRLSKRQFGLSQEQYNHGGKFIHVDIDEHELNRALKEDLSINMCVKSFLSALNSDITNSTMGDLTEWKKHLKQWQEKFSSNTEINETGLDPVKFIKKISPNFSENAIITTDVGQNQMWCAQGIEIKKGQRVLSSGGLGCMGFSLPAAIGARIADSKASVIAFMGDGGLQMNLQELQMLVNKVDNVKCVVFNNSTLGMIKELQKKFFGSRFNGTGKDYDTPDLKALAKTYKLNYLKIEDKYDEKKFLQLIDDNKSCLIEVVLNKANTYVLTKGSEPNVYKDNSIEI